MLLIASSSVVAHQAQKPIRRVAERHGIDEVNFTFEGHKSIAIAASACSITRNSRPAT